jgi:hypothetical protein
MDLEETEARNDCAGKGQQQFHQPTKSGSCSHESQVSSQVSFETVASR